MLTFYLIRHGHKEFIPFDPPLNEIGIQQAKATAEFLKNTKFKEIISSPKLRTRQTAEFISQYQSIPIGFDNRLIERLEWEKNETFEEFVNEYSKTDLDRAYKPVKGDSSINKGEKMRDVLKECILKHKDGEILIVTHGGATGDLLRNLFGENKISHDIDPTTKTPHIHISECSITRILFSNNKFKLDTINDTTHLPVDLISTD